jgi:hypothetical protein
LRNAASDSVVTGEKAGVGSSHKKKTPGIASLREVTMCFEFEWLYWAQMAQEEEQRRKDAANRADARDADRVPGSSGPLADPPRQEQREPLHA